jgi:Rrf2 family iron-sulfur cluster assembly transcriptional regulator
MWTELDRLINGYLDGVTVADLMKAREGGDYVI